mmetsp:Transcript_9873/g.25313  ORF Transcript_9873/g.25313 Transcript_9873/m.25313 type:complete len:374 (-) Transcript_9873:88-1209(-)
MSTYPTTATALRMATGAGGGASTSTVAACLAAFLSMLFHVVLISIGLTSASTAGDRSLKRSVPVTVRSTPHRIGNSDESLTVLLPGLIPLTSGEPYPFSNVYPLPRLSLMSNAMGVTSYAKSEATASSNSSAELTDEYLQPGIRDSVSTVPTERSTPIPTTVVWNFFCVAALLAWLSTLFSSSTPDCMSVRNTTRDMGLLFPPVLSKLSPAPKPLARLVEPPATTASSLASTSLSLREPHLVSGSSWCVSWLNSTIPTRSFRVSCRTMALMHRRATPSFEPSSALAPHHSSSPVSKRDRIEPEMSRTRTRSRSGRPMASIPASSYREAKLTLRYCPSTPVEMSLATPLSNRGLKSATSSAGGAGNLNPPSVFS